MDRVSLFLLGFVTESYCRESGLKSFVLKVITGRGCLIKTERSLRLGNTLPEQWRNVTSKVHSGTTVGATCQERLGCVAGLQESPALGQTGWRGGTWLRHRAELSQERTAPADFILSSSLKLT